MTTEVRTTVSHRTESVSVTTIGGREIGHGYDVDLSISYPPGDEDGALMALSEGIVTMSAQINASRPAASTPKEGTTR